MRGTSDERRRLSRWLRGQVGEPRGRPVLSGHLLVPIAVGYVIAHDCAVRFFARRRAVLGGCRC